jgi:hypothetical protein
MGYTRKACNVLVARPEYNRQFEVPDRQDNININDKEIW